MITYDSDFITSSQIRPRIVVLGIGGAGCNAINSIIEENIKNINCIAVNTDIQALVNVKTDNKIQIGIQTTSGMGAGANPEIGKISAEEDIETIVNSIQDADIVFLIAGLGGGTASGALPVIAKVLQERQILSIAILTKPFVFEGSRRMQTALNALVKIEEYVDTLIVIPNQKLFESNLDDNIPLKEAFNKINKVIATSIEAVSSTIHNTEYINVDFADVKTIMTRMGKAMIGIGCASGENRAKDAIEKVFSSSLLEHKTLDGAHSILLNIQGDKSLSLSEINVIAGYIHNKVHPEANIIIGSNINDSDADELKVILIATGFEDQIKSRNSQKNNYNLNSNSFLKNNLNEKSNYYGFNTAGNNMNKNNYNNSLNQSNNHNNNINLSESKMSLDVPTFLRKNSLDL